MRDFYPHQRVVPNVVSTTNVVAIPTIFYHSIVLVVNIPSSISEKKIDVEHPEHDRAYVENNMVKGKQVVIQSEFSTRWPAITNEDLFPNIEAHSLQFYYIILFLAA